MKITSARSASVLVAALAVQSCNAAPPGPTGAFHHAHVLATSSQAGTAWTPAQLQQAYSVPSNQTGLGKTGTIIIVAYHYPAAQSDFNHFGATYGFPESTLTIINLAGNVSNSEWAIEEMTDIEMVRAMNQFTPITVIEAKANDETDIMAAIDYANSIASAGSVISMSLGDSEYGEESGATAFSPKTGTTWVAASGDTTSPSFPATHPGVIAVGGTTLSSIMPRTETTWTSGGCGLSIAMTKPSFQDGVNASNFRAVPDVCLVANPSSGVLVYCSVAGGTLAIGGTSVSTPLFAGIVGLVNSSRLKASKMPLSSTTTSTNLQLQYALYGLLSTNSAQGRDSLYDITQGTGCESAAGPGYDIVTGIGSVNVQPLITYLGSL